MSNQPVLSENFMLECDEAVELYQRFAADQPIADFHCHLPPDEVADNHRFKNITEAWLGGDHYKWRAMRSAGINERYITGDADDREKFQKWAEAMPQLLRNPLYVWTHMELNTFFGVSDKLLGPNTAEEIWDACNAQIAGDDFTARGLMDRSKVTLACTTDDPIDSLEHHAAVAAGHVFGILE